MSTNALTAQFLPVDSREIIAAINAVRLIRRLLWHSNLEYHVLLKLCGHPHSAHRAKSAKAETQIILRLIEMGLVNHRGTVSPLVKEIAWEVRHDKRPGDPF